MMVMMISVHLHGKIQPRGMEFNTDATIDPKYLLKTRLDLTSFVHHGVSLHMRDGDCPSRIQNDHGDRLDAHLVGRQGNRPRRTDLFRTPRPECARRALCRNRSQVLTRVGLVLYGVFERGAALLSRV
jgi:hypothetical protein